AICLNEAALSKLTAGEAAVVVAHELSHHAHGDGRRSRLLGWFMWWGALLFAWPMLPLLIPEDAGPALALLVAPTVAVVWWLAAWVLSLGIGAYFRRTEKRAYREALEMAADPAAFRSLVRGLASRGALLGKLRPFHRLIAVTHPSVEELLELADEYENATRSADMV
ncbi:MAG: M48 family metallopeptidase, partial [Phycisphaerae bacterium]